MGYSKNYEDAFVFTVGEEGGYVFDPDDPGGETNWGISKRAYPDEDIKNMTKERAMMLAYRDYWLKAGCDKLSLPLNIVVFDNAYHSGVGAALENLRQYPDWKDLIVERIEDMLDIVDRRPTSLKYLKGWVKRAVGFYRKILEAEHPLSEAYK